MEWMQIKKVSHQRNDSPFSYHLFLKSEIENAIEKGQLKKYHYNFLRNILEKTSTFLGYENWGELLPKTNDGKTDPYESRIMALCQMLWSIPDRNIFCPVFHEQNPIESRCFRWFLRSGLFNKNIIRRLKFTKLLKL